MQGERPSPLTAGQLAHTPVEVAPDDPIDEAIQALGRADEDGLPVANPTDHTIVGWITQRDILTTYRQRLNAERDT